MPPKLCSYLRKLALYLFVLFVPRAGGLFGPVWCDVKALFNVVLKL